MLRLGGRESRDGQEQGISKRSGLIWSVVSVLCVLHPLIFFFLGLPFIKVQRPLPQSIGLGTGAFFSEGTLFIGADTQEKNPSLCFFFFFLSHFLFRLGLFPLILDDSKLHRKLKMINQKSISLCKRLFEKSQNVYNINSLV